MKDRRSGPCRENLSSTGKRQLAILSDRLTLSCVQGLAWRFCPPFVYPFVPVPKHGSQPVPISTRSSILFLDEANRRKEMPLRPRRRRRFRHSVLFLVVCRGYMSNRRRPPLARSGWSTQSVSHGRILSWILGFAPLAASPIGGSAAGAPGHLEARSH